MNTRDFSPTLQAPVAWLQGQAGTRPDSPALISDHAVLRYRDLQVQAVSLARVLAHRGVAPGVVIATASTSARLLALLTYAAPLLGCVLQPLNPALPAPRRAALLSQSGATWLIADEDDAGGPALVLSAAQLLEELRFAVEAVPLPVPAQPLGLKDIHLIIATSGSSGEPKGVMLSGRNIAASVRASRERLRIDPGDLWLACLPLFHVGGLSIFYRCVEAGAAVLLHQGFDPERVIADIAAHNVTHLSLVPTMLARLLECAGARPAPPSLRYVLVGGAALPSALAARATTAGWPLCVSYGMSETCSQVATLCSVPLDWQGGAVGQPLPGIEVRLARHPALHADEDGLICVRGDGVMEGYANPERRFGVGLAEGGWFVTADLGRLDALGNLAVLGRADDLLISGGENVSPQLVEEIIAACPGITDIGITARQDAVWGDRLVAVFAGSINETALEDWCRTALAGALRPRGFIKVAALPRNAAGKLDRRALRALVNYTLQ